MQRISRIWRLRRQTASPGSNGLDVRAGAASLAILFFGFACRSPTLLLSRTQLTSHPQCHRGLEFARSVSVVGVRSLDVDASSTCGATTSGGWQCWGRPESFSARVDEISLTFRPWLGHDSRLLWTHRVPTYLQPAIPAFDDEPSVPTHSVEAMRAMRRPSSYRCGWGMCDADSQRIHVDAEDSDIQVERQQGEIVIEKIVRSANQLCILDRSHNFRCIGRMASAVDDPVAAVLRTEPVCRGAVQISSTNDRVCVVLSSREVWCRTAIEGGRPDMDWTLIGREVEEIATTIREVCMRKTTGQVECLRDTTASLTPPTVTMRTIESPAVQLVAGEEHMCVRSAEGRVWCWGEASFGRLGTYLAPVGPSRIQLLGRVRMAAAGFGHTCALTDANEVFCWGLSYDGQTGDPHAITPRSTSNIGRYRTTALPRRVPLAIVPDHLLAYSLGTCVSVGEDRWCWGNNHGQLMSPMVNSRLIPATALPTNLQTIPASIRGVAARTFAMQGIEHECVVRDDHRVYCRGNNGRNQLGHLGPSSADWTLVVGLTDVVGVTNGGAHSCAWNRCGELYCWGSNQYLQLSMPAALNPDEPHPVVVEAVSQPHRGSTAEGVDAGLADN